MKCVFPRALWAAAASLLNTNSASKQALLIDYPVNNIAFNCSADRSQFYSTHLQTTIVQKGNYTNTQYNSYPKMIMSGKKKLFSNCIMIMLVRQGIILLEAITVCNI